jgi:acyl-homoserine lactone acylase PvdQ
MAEAFGAEYVEADRFARLMRYRGDMEAEWTSYAPDAKEIATAFTAGINAAIDSFGDKLPVEFQMLGLHPKKWSLLRTMKISLVRGQRFTILPSTKTEALRAPSRTISTKSPISNLILQ